MKICLAGTLALVESPQSLLESKYLLESFYSIQEWQIPYLKKAELFLLDSGAFTFLNNTKKGAGVNWDEYVDKYAEFITKHNIKHFFELDIDSVVGYEMVKELTKKLEEKTQRQCIPVWHKKRGLSEWKRITQEYNYVAIGGIVTREIRPTEYKHFTTLLKIASKNHCKVHGLGFTYTKELKKYPFYSADSTSWTGMNRFNSYCKYIPNEGIITWIPKNGRRVKQESRTDALLYSFREWLKFQQYAERNL